VRWLGRRVALAALPAVGALMVNACGGGGAATHGQTSGEPDGLVEGHTVTYTSSFDGSPVTALVATPRAGPSRGCVIVQYGLGSKKEDSAQTWQAMAALGLTTVSIDIRYHGARASSPTQLEQVVRNSNTIAEMLRGTVADLRSAIDVLEKQPYCRHNVAYVGTSLGGGIGTILAATDKRVKAAAIISTPGTFRATLTTPGIPYLPGVAHHPRDLAAALRILSPLDPARFIGRISPRPVLIMSGREDETVPLSSARVLQAAARKPSTIVDYNGGHDPASGPDATSNAQAIASFLLRNIVEPTYGVSGNANGGFTQR
jgi:fermentation-respiration switch protein FrsA (DUF1100 family)